MSLTTYADLLAAAQNWQPASVLAPDGVAVSAAFWTMAQPRGSVLIIPGRNESWMKYTHVAADLAAMGLQSLCYTPRKHVRDFATYDGELGAVFNQLWLPQIGNNPAFVLAHSTGANLALRRVATGESCIHGVDGLMVSAPLVGMNYRQKYLPDFVSAGLTALMGKFKPDEYALGQKPYSRTDMVFANNRYTSDENRFALMLDLFDAHAESRPDGVRWGWAAAAQRACRDLQGRLDQIKLPLLVLQTPHDQSVSGPAQSWLPASDHLILPHSRHEIFMEQPEIYNAAMAKIDDFTRQVGQRRAPSL